MRIIHISDLHFGMHKQEIIEPFLNELEALKPAVIIISGDVTQRAKVEQYVMLREFLQRLPGKVLIVPGNHDIPLYNPVMRLLHPFKRYKQYVSSELDSHYSDKEINILGLNSATPYKIKDGSLSDRSIQRIKTHFSASGQLNILFFHHNLNYFSGMHHPLNNAEEFIHYLRESPIHIVCTGHLHYANLKLITKNQLGQCAIVHAGSLLCQRSKDKMNSFYVIEVEGLKCRVNWLVFSNNQFKSQQSNEIDFN